MFFKNSVFFQKFRVFQKIPCFFNICTRLYIVYIVYIKNDRKKVQLLFINISFVKQCFMVIVQCLHYDSLILVVFHRVVNGGIP